MDKYFASTCAHRQRYHFFILLLKNLLFFNYHDGLKKKKKKQIIWPNLECVVFLIPPKNPKGAYPKTLKVHASFITILVYASITSLKNEVLSVIHNSSSLSFAAATGSPSAWQTYLLNSAAMGRLSRWLRGQTTPHSPGKCQHTELHRFSNCTPLHSDSEAPMPPSLLYHLRGAEESGKGAI